MRILLLAGTGEAAELAWLLSDAGHEVTSSLAGATRSPKALAGQVRSGGFGGDAGFQAWLAQHRPELVIDATHPFAARVSRRSARICKAMGLKYLQLLRPPWPVLAERQQYEVASAKEARRLVPPGAVVFLATGRQTLESFGAFSDCHLICRQIDPPEGPFPFPNGEFRVGRPPFSVEDEVALFKELKVDWLIVKNAGGAASYSKIEAAALLGIPVIFLARPVQPDAEQVASIPEVMKWVARHADH
jgi:precorrin-6A/cobalt-precorrin-6A reductase